MRRWFFTLFICGLAVEPGVSAESAPAAKLTEAGKHLSLSIYATSGMVTNPVSLCFDRFGRLYVVDSGRWGHGVEDSRQHPFWVLDDLSIQTLADREAMYNKWIGMGRFEKDWFTRAADTVLRLDDSDGDGQADDREVFATFRHALDGNAAGILWRDGKVFLGCSPALWMLQDRKGDGHAENRRILIDGFGLRVGVGGHDLRGLEWGPEGKLYFAVGDRGYRVATQDGKSFVDLDSGAVFRCDPDGRNLEVVAKGFRDPRDLAFDAYGNLFLVENRIGGNIALYQIRWGMDAGWRVGYENHEVFGEQLGLKAGVRPASKASWSAERSEAAVPPLATFPGEAHGLAVEPVGASTTKEHQRLFISAGAGGLFVVDVERRAEELNVGGRRALLSGGMITSTEWGFDAGIYVADRDASQILVLRDAKKGDAVDVRDLFLDGFHSFEMTRLGELLGHVDYRVRQAAQFELVSRGRESAAIFNQALLQKENRFRRLHAIHGIGMLEGVESGVTGRLFAYLKDGDPVVRALSARVIGKAGNARGVHLVKPLLKDPKLSVRVEAIRALGRLGENVLERHLPDAKSLTQALAAHVAALPQQRVPAQQHYYPWRDVYFRAAYFHRAPSLVEFLSEDSVRWVDESVRAIFDFSLTAKERELRIFTDTVLQRMPQVPGAPRVRVSHRVVDELHLRSWERLIQMEFRAGKKENARRVLAIASAEFLAMEVRLAAIGALRTWAEPHPVDWVSGVVWSYPKDRDSDIRDVIERAPRSLKNASHPQLRAAVDAMAFESGLTAEWGSLYSRARNPKRKVKDRVAAILKLEEEKPRHLQRLMELLLVEQPLPIRAAALGVYMRTGGHRSVLEHYLNHADLPERQAGYAVLGTLDGEDVVRRLKSDLDRLQAGRFPEGLRLDLLSAARAQGDPALKDALESVPEEVAESAMLVGGDVIRGRNLLLGHSGGQCLVCHTFDGVGRDVGPALDRVGGRSRESLLQSLIRPDAELSKGYGHVSVTLKNGRKIAGFLVEEDRVRLGLRTAEGKVEEVLVVDIVSRDPARSMMPSMLPILSQQEIRDVVEFLATQD